MENNSKIIAKQCDEAISSYKKDYAKLLHIVKEKEGDIEVLKKKISHNDEVVASLHDRLLSVVVLEHKIKEIDLKYQSDLNKNVELQQNKIREIQNTRKFSPNFFRRIQEYENSKRGLEKSLEQKDLEKKKIMENKKIEIQEKNNLFVKVSNSLNSVNNEREKLKETISIKNKEIFNLEAKTKMYF